MRKPCSVPDFLIIGAMKAGTTTLFRDLVGHPDLFLPQEKEPETLTRFGDDLDAIRQDYASLFRPAKPGKMLGEASTAYTKRPDFVGVARRALTVCGPGLKLIYLKRDPIARIVSHYKHEAGMGRVTRSLAEVVLSESKYVDYSRYEWQLSPWREVFPAESFLILSFEEYIVNRAKTAAQVCAFLGLDPAGVPPLLDTRAFNASEGKRVATGGLGRAIVRAPLYQRWIKPMVPWGVRDRLASLMLRKAEQGGIDLDDHTRSQLLFRLSE